MTFRTALPIVFLVLLGGYVWHAGGLAAESDSLAITHGPLLGRIGTDQVAVWARTSGPGSFRVFYGKSPEELTETSEPIETNAESDFTGWTLLTGLDSHSKYFYAVATGDEAPEAERLRGHFHTLPEPGDVADPDLNPDGLFNLRFEFACGNNQNPDAGSSFGPALPAFATLYDELVQDERPSEIDFAILNGDWLYENATRGETPQDWLTTVNAASIPRTLEIMPSLAGVWANYRSYLENGQNLARFHRYVPYYFTFDDHEILNDVYGSGTPGRRNRRAVFRDIGLRGWYDYLGWANDFEPSHRLAFGRAELEGGDDRLHDPDAAFDDLNLDEAGTLHVHWGTPDAGLMTGVDDTTGGDPNARVYEIVEVLDDETLRIRPPAAADGEVSYSIARRSYWNKRLANAELFFLDTRSYREMHDVNDRRADVSMLGEPQKRWLKEAMEASGADFLFVVSSVNFSIPHVGGTGSATGMPANKDDAWTVFLNEREEMIDFWDALDKPVFILTGDLHNSFAIKVTPQVWEFASGPHNSVNHPARSEGDRPPNGRYDSFGREVEIRWSSYIANDTPNALRRRPVYCVVRVNNVFRNDKPGGDSRWIAYNTPQAVFQYYDGLTGELLYAESILAD